MNQCNIIAISAGFDRHEQDWGGALKTEDYDQAAKIIKEFSEKPAKEEDTQS